MYLYSHFVLLLLFPVSVEDQMEQSSLYFWDLLEGSDKAVVGTTCEFFYSGLMQ